MLIVLIGFIFIFHGFVYSQIIVQRIQKESIYNKDKSDSIMFIESFSPEEYSINWYQQIYEIYKHRDELYLLNKSKQSIVKYRNKNLDLSFSTKLKETIKRIEKKVNKKVSGQYELRIKDGHIYFIDFLRDKEHKVEEIIIAKLTINLEFVQDFYKEGIFHFNLMKGGYRNISHIKTIVIDKNNNIYLFFDDDKQKEVIRIVKVTTDQKGNRICTEVDIDSKYISNYYLADKQDNFYFYIDDGVYLFDFKNLIYLDLIHKNIKLIKSFDFSKINPAEIYVDYTDSSVFIGYVDYNLRYLYVERFTKEHPKKTQILTFEISRKTNTHKQKINVLISKVRYNSGKIYVLYHIYSGIQVESYLLIFELNTKRKENVSLTSLIGLSNKNKQTDIYIPKEFFVENMNIWIAGTHLSKKIFRHSFLSKINLYKKHIELEYKFILRNIFELNDRGFDNLNFFKLESGYASLISRNGIYYLVRINEDLTVDKNFAEKGILIIPLTEIIEEISDDSIDYYDIEYDYYNLECHFESIKQDKKGNLYIYGSIYNHKSNYYYLIKVDQKGNIDKNFNKKGFVIIDKIFNTKQSKNKRFKVILDEKHLYIIHIQNKKIYGMAVISSKTGIVEKLTIFNNQSNLFKYNEFCDTEVISGNVFIVLQNRNLQKTYLVKLDSNASIDKNFGKNGFIIIDKIDLPNITHIDGKNLILTGKHLTKKELCLMKLDEKGNIDNTLGIVFVKGNILDKLIGDQLFFINNVIKESDEKLLLSVYTKTYIGILKYTKEKDKNYIVEVDYSKKNKKVICKDITKFEEKVKVIIQKIYGGKINDIIIQYTISVDKEKRKKLEGIIKVKHSSLGILRGLIQIHLN
ncbi:MAG: hypothetical protein N2657_06040 [bacterium]|nr:hypothetical protein [bacterium]